MESLGKRIPQVGDWISRSEWVTAGFDENLMDWHRDGFYQVVGINTGYYITVRVFYKDGREQDSGGYNLDSDWNFKDDVVELSKCDIPDYLYDRDEDI